GCRNGGAAAGGDLTALPAPEASALPPLREVARRFGIAARGRFGQHFLFDLNLTRKIARAAGRLAPARRGPLGARPGGPARAPVAAGARQTVGVESDRRCVAALDDLARLHPGRLTVVADDALKVDPCALVAAPRKIVANLPYNIATTLLLGWLDRIREF